jgi:hypothetical protein
MADTQKEAKRRICTEVSEGSKVRAAFRQLHPFRCIHAPHVRSQNAYATLALGYCGLLLKSHGESMLGE